MLSDSAQQVSRTQLKLAHLGDVYYGLLEKSFDGSNNLDVYCFNTTE